METKVTFDITPFMTELFKIRAEIRTLSKVLLNDEQMQKFNEIRADSLKDVITEFLKVHPNVITGADELRKSLGI